MATYRKYPIRNLAAPFIKVINTFVISYLVPEVWKTSKRMLENI